jgi:hypothetical protein
MASQRAVAILASTPEPEGRVRARLRLACGCEVDYAGPADRLVETEDGGRRAVGKYPCPEGHPLVRVR